MVFVAAACAGTGSEKATPAEAGLPVRIEPVGATAPMATPQISSRKSAATPPPARSPPPASSPPPPPDPAQVAKANAFVTQAQELYRAGAYEKAEAAVKESLVIYPFLPEANLLMGKIFLLKGSATRDPALVHSARLMFEMAHTLDPSMREADVLLELFRHEPSQ
ncbi:MAG: hypothetical protein HY903_07105 [Deltaproteobacteria bacterium]|nr:hypothetical protein [Deltaproteobacteria bacterium]